MNGLMDERATSFCATCSSSLSDLFARGTSSLSYFFSGQPFVWATSSPTLLWAASQLALLQAAQFFSSRSCYSAFRNVQLQFRKAQEWTVTMRLATPSWAPAAIPQSRSVAAKLMLCCAQLCQCVADGWKPAYSRSAAPNQPIFAQRQQCGFSALLRIVHILLTPSSKSAPIQPVFCNLKRGSSSRYSPVHFLLTTFPDGGPQPQKQTPYFGDPRSHITQKNRGFRARKRFHTWIHTLANCYTSHLIDKVWHREDQRIEGV